MAAAPKGNTRIETLGRFVSVNRLWEGDSARYPSEQSARWALRSLKGALIEAEALAIHRGRLMIDPDRAQQVMERNAIQAAKAKLG